MIDYQGIQFHGIDEFLDLTAAVRSDIEYTVSWIDVHLHRARTSRAASSCRATTRKVPAS